jgi:hypothetical protein
VFWLVSIRVLPVFHSLVFWLVSIICAQSQAVDAECVRVDSDDAFARRAAREEGAIAASAFGAGFGGSVWALIAKTDVGEDPTFLAVWLMQSPTTVPHDSPCNGRTTAFAMVARQLLQRSQDSLCNGRTATHGLNAD